MEHWEEQEEEDEGHAAGGRCTWGYYNSPPRPQAPGPTLRVSYIYTCCRHSVTGILLRYPQCTHVDLHEGLILLSPGRRGNFALYFFSSFLLLLLLFWVDKLLQQQIERQEREEVELFWLSLFQNMHPTHKKKHSFIGKSSWQNKTHVCSDKTCDKTCVYWLSENSCSYSFQWS